MKKKNTHLKNLIFSSNKKFDNFDQSYYKHTKNTTNSIIILEKKINDFLDSKGIKEVNLKEEFYFKRNSSSSSLKTNPSLENIFLNMNKNPLLLKRKKFSDL